MRLVEVSKYVEKCSTIQCVGIFIEVGSALVLLKSRFVCL
jgi:hypothetical protein